MTTLRLVLGDQLSPQLATLSDLDPADDVVLFLEVDAETRYVPHHPQKIALVLSAMRHFAAELAARGVRVDYVRLDDADNRGTFDAEIERALARHRPRRLVVTEPGEWRVWEMMQAWSARFGLPVEIRADDRFLCSRDEFARWAAGRRQFRMEHFYRMMRRRTGWLMRGDQPSGGRWNFDADNRKALPPGMAVPAALRFAPDALTQEVLSLVRVRYAHHFGAVDGFGWPVTRADAMAALAHFVEHALPRFGDYQDAMAEGRPWLFHSLLSTSLNLGLLDPREVCEAALASHDGGRAPLAAVEGFVRQVLGWREYVRGLGRLHRADVRLLPSLLLRSPAEARTRRVPVQPAVLALPRAKCGAARVESAPGDAVSHVAGDGAGASCRRARRGRGVSRYLVGGGKGRRSADGAGIHGMNT